jgi:putative transposase
MQLRYSYRLEPQPRHRIALGKAFGCARVVFNDGLRARQDGHDAGLPYVTDGELSARLTAAKATPERAWLNEVSSVVLQQALADLNAAYRNFFASLKGERNGPKVKLPRFRSLKDHRQAIRFTRNARFFITPSGKLWLPKIGDLPVRWSRPLQARTWQCGACGAWLDRDINAAVNVAKAAGLAATACGAQVRPEPVPAQRSEAGTHPKSRREVT